MPTNPLRLTDVIRLAQIVEAAVHGSKVRWTTPDSEEIHEGVVRRIADADGSILTPETDVRDGVLVVTCWTIERTIPVTLAMSLIGEGAIAFE